MHSACDWGACSPSPYSIAYWMYDSTLACAWPDFLSSEQCPWAMPMAWLGADQQTTLDNTTCKMHMQHMRMRAMRWGWGACSLGPHRAPESAMITRPIRSCWMLHPTFQPCMISVDILGGWRLGSAPQLSLVSSEYHGTIGACRLYNCTAIPWYRRSIMIP